MDALTHAIEGFVSSEWNQHADAFALQAIRLIRDNLPRAVERHLRRSRRAATCSSRRAWRSRPRAPARSGSRTRCRTRAAGHYGVAHGVANAINLPWVIEYNAAGGEEIADRYRDDRRAARRRSRRRRRGRRRARSPTTCRELDRGLGLPQRLSEVGVPEDGHPGAGRGRDGRRLHARQPARADRGGLHGALPQGAVSASDEARDWAGPSPRSASSAGSVRADRRPEPGGRPGGAVPRGDEPADRSAHGGLLGRVVRRRRARGGGLFSKAVRPARDPGQVAHARSRQGDAAVERRVARDAARGHRRAPRDEAQGRVREPRVQQALPGHGAERATTRSRCARCSAPAFSTG